MDIRGLSLLLAIGIGLFLANFLFRLGVGTGGLFLLLALAIALRYLVVKLAPIMMPLRRLRVWGLGWAGGFLGSLAVSALGGWGPQIGGAYLLGGVLGTALILLGWGLYPFLKILSGKR